jgi:hypothetical protein
MAVLTRDFALDRGFDVALIDEIRSVTWAELDLRVNRLVNGNQLKPGCYAMKVGSISVWGPVANS